MVRILHVVKAMNCGGTENLIMNLYRHIDKSKVQFDFLVNTEEKAFFDDEIENLGGHIYRVPAFKVYNWRKYVKALNGFFIDHPEISIVHGHLGSSAAIYLSVAKKHGCYAIAHSHATKATERSLNNLMFSIFSYFTRFIADEFIACSTQAGIDRYGSKIVDSAKFSVMRNGIDVSSYVYDIDIRKAIRNKYGVSDSVTVVGHVGRFVEAKNHMFLLEAFADFYSKQPDSELWLIGDGELRNAIMEKAGELGILSSIRFVGLVRNVNEYEQAFDLFLFTSFYEGLGIALIEAETAGLRCIISDRIPSEADIGAGLITRMSLNEPVEEWGNTLIANSKYEREDMSSFAIKAGYDIKTVADDLCIKYLAIKRLIGDM